MKLVRMFALKMRLLGAMTVPMLFVSAFGQQEVDPSWYDPWASASKPAAQTARNTDQESPKKAAATANRMTPHKTKTQTREVAARSNEHTQNNEQTQMAST